MNRRLRNLARQVEWLRLIVALLCLSAIVWVLVAPQYWTSCAVLLGAALALAVLGRDVQ